MKQIEESNRFFVKVYDLSDTSYSKPLNITENVAENESDNATASNSSGATAPEPAVFFDASVEVETTKPLKSNGARLRRLRLWSARAAKETTLQSQVVGTTQDTPEATSRPTKPKLQALFKKYDLSRLRGKKCDSASYTESGNGSSTKGLGSQGKRSLPSPAIQEKSPGRRNVLPTITEGHLPHPIHEISLPPSSVVSDVTPPVSLSDILDDLDRTKLLDALFGGLKDDESFDDLVNQARAIKRHNRRGSSRGSSSSQGSSSSRGSSTLGSSTLGSSSVGSSTLGSSTIGSTSQALSREGSTGGSGQVSKSKHVSEKKRESRKKKRRDEDRGGDATFASLWDAFTEAVLDL
jgi:hypothetical protein